MLLVTLAGAALSVSCNASTSTESDNKKTIEKSYTVDKFSDISVQCACDIYYVQGTKTSLTLKGTAERLEKIEVKSVNGTLTIKQKSGKNWKGSNFNFRNNSIVAYVTSPNISEVSISGSGDFTSEKPMSSNNLSFKVSGCGDIRLGNVKCNSFTSRVNGSGDIKISSMTAQKVSFAISGSGDVDAHLVDVADTNVGVSGSGDILLNGKNCGAVSGHVSGSGDVYVKGDFKPVNVKVSGSGDLHVN